MSALSGRVIAGLPRPYWRNVKLPKHTGSWYIFVWNSTSATIARGSHRPWTQQEKDAVLHDLHNDISYRETARKLGRSLNQVAVQFSKLRNAPSQYARWTKEEDDILHTMKLSGHPARDISKQLGNRSVHSVQRRWERHFLFNSKSAKGENLDQARRPWTDAEFEHLIDLKENQGLRMRDIPNLLPGRTLRSIQGKYFYSKGEGEAKSKPAKISPGVSGKIAELARGGKTAKDIEAYLQLPDVSCEDIRRLLWRLGISTRNYFSKEEMEKLRKLIREGLPWTRIQSDHFPDRSVGHLWNTWHDRAGRNRTHDFPWRNQKWNSTDIAEVVRLRDEERLTFRQIATRLERQSTASVASRYYYQLKRRNGTKSATVVSSKTEKDTLSK